MTYPTKCRGLEKSKERWGASLKEQCKEIEENKGMGKTRDLFRKTWNIKATFHARMGMIKERNGKDLTELYKKGIYDPDNHDSVVIHLEPDILESEVK